MTARRDQRFRFVQLDVPGRLGLEDGRYLVRGDGAEESIVVVVQTLGANPAGRRRRRRRPRPAGSGEPPGGVPLTRLTVVPADASDPASAAARFERMADDADAAEREVVAGLATVNSVLRAHRIATQDPYGHEIGRDTPLVARAGFGTGDGLAEGRWERAVEVPPPARRERRAQALRPQERLAAILAGREPIDVCEPLLLRARADLDQEHLREAALQLRAGLDALLAELPGRAGPDQEEDLATLDGRRHATARAAEEALRGPLPAERAAEIAETLRVCERVLRRRQALRE